MPLDWFDIRLHSGIAIVAVGAFCVIAALVPDLWPLGPASIAANTIGWPVREAIQRRLKSSFDWWRPWLWSEQKQMEAWPPVVLGNAAGLAILWAI